MGRLPPPLPGESASGFVIRLSRFLSVDLSRPLRGMIGDPLASASAVHQSQLIEFLADFSGLPRTSFEPLFALPQSPGQSVKLGDFIVRAAHVDQSRRKVSPALFASDVEAGRPLYHRLTWSLAHLKEDPDTGHPLIDTCDRCGASLRWSLAFDVGQCDVCTRRLWISPQGPSAEQNVMDKLLQDLFCSSLDARLRARSALPVSIRAWPEGDILDLLHVIESFGAAVAGKLDVDPSLGWSNTENAVLSGIVSRGVV